MESVLFLYLYKDAGVQIQVDLYHKHLCPLRYLIGLIHPYLKRSNSVL